MGDHKILKLELVGHKHGHPEQLITSSYSWPTGKDEEMQAIVGDFCKAFSPIKIVAFDNMNTVAYWIFEGKEFRHIVLPREAQDG